MCQTTLFRDYARLTEEILFATIDLQARDGDVHHRPNRVNVNMSKSVMPITKQFRSRSATWLAVTCLDQQHEHAIPLDRRQHDVSVLLEHDRFLVIDYFAASLHDLQSRKQISIDQRDVKYVDQTMIHSPSGATLTSVLIKIMPRLALGTWLLLTWRYQINDPAVRRDTRVHVGAVSLLFLPAAILSSVLLVTTIARNVSLFSFSVLEALYFHLPITVLLLLLLVVAVIAGCWCCNLLTLYAVVSVVAARRLSLSSCSLSFAVNVAVACLNNSKASYCCSIAK